MIEITHISQFDEILKSREEIRLKKEIAELNNRDIGSHNIIIELSKTYNADDLIRLKKARVI